MVAYDIINLSLLIKKIWACPFGSGYPLYFAMLRVRSYPSRCGLSIRLNILRHNS